MERRLKKKVGKYVFIDNYYHFFMISIDIKTVLLKLDLFFKQDLNDLVHPSPLDVSEVPPKSNHENYYNGDTPSGKLFFKTLMARTEKHLNNIEDLRNLLRARSSKIDPSHLK